MMCDNILSTPSHTCNTIIPRISSQADIMGPLDKTRQHAKAWIIYCRTSWCHTVDIIITPKPRLMKIWRNSTLCREPFNVSTQSYIFNVLSINIIMQDCFWAFSAWFRRYSIAQMGGIICHNVRFPSLNLSTDCTTHTHTHTHTHQHTKHVGFELV